MLSKNPQFIKGEQLEWLRRRETEATQEYFDFETGLRTSYAYRILALFKDNALRTYFLKEFMKNPSDKTDEFMGLRGDVTTLAIAALWTAKEGEWYNDVLRLGGVVMPVSEQKIVMAFMTSEGAYSQGYSFFTLEKKGEVIQMERLALPFGGNGQDVMGGMDFEEVKGKKGTFIIKSYEHISSWECCGEQITWRIDKKGVQVVERKERVYKH